jgi:hypothetical protein
MLMLIFLPFRLNRLSRHGAIVFCMAVSVYVCVFAQSLYVRMSRSRDLALLKVLGSH